MPVITASFRLMRISLKSLLRQIKIIRLTVKKTIRIRLREVDYEEYRYNYSSIEQLTNSILNKQKSTDKKINGISFEEILKQQTQPVKFSKHASMRLTQRNINLSDDQSMRLQKGIAAADSKGVNDSLVLVDDIAFIVNVPK